MLTILAVAFVSLMILSHVVVAQEGQNFAKLKNKYLLSKTKEPFLYSQLFKKYQLVIFAKVEDCSSCISEHPPWIQMILSKGVSTCFVIISKSFRAAKYQYEANSLPFDFYCDTLRAASEVVARKNTPVVLLFDDSGREIFFDSPLYENKRFVDVVTSADFKVKEKKNSN